MRERADKATPGPWFRHTAPRDSSETKAKWLADTCRGDDPLQVLVSASDDPQFAYLVPALTGDGPTSIANAEFIAHARAEVPQLLAALTAVLELHKLIVYRDPRNEPDDLGDGYYGTARYCEHCGDTAADYPCETVQAIVDALAAGR